MSHGGHHTVEEAVEWVLKALTREYRRACLKWYREQYGDLFADQVESKVLAKWGERKSA